MPHPERLGKYPITGVIGQGAMGIVYKGYDPVIARPVAIKTIRGSLAELDDPASSLSARFRNEAQAVGRLSHPGIVAIYEYGEDGDTAFIAMEYVEGHTLSQLLAAAPLPPEGTVVRVMTQLLDALQCAHTAGVWHRDIKPANLIITADGRVKVTDFGIARIETHAMTLVTSIIGTPGYVAPEQYLGAPLDHRIDLFAAGVLLYRMLTADSPFAGPPEAVMYKTVNVDPPAPSIVTSGRRAAGFDAVVAKALAKKPADRWASAAEFKRALMQAAGAQDPSGTDATLPWRPIEPPTATLPIGTPPPRTATSPSGGSLLTAKTIGGWDTSALAPIEHALALVLGPMAKLLVRRAARDCIDVASLAAKVAEEIPEDGERAAFLRRIAAVVRTHPELAPGPSAPAATPTPTPTVTGPGGPLPSEALRHALRVLTAHMGPVARIVVKQAAAQATSLEAFHERLADTVPDGPERRRMLRLLRAAR